jgi:hypothetical protein
VKLKTQTQIRETYHVVVVDGMMIPTADAAPSAVPVQHSPSPIPLTPAQTPESLERIAYTRTHPSPPLPKRPKSTTQRLTSSTIITLEPM